MQEPEVFRGPGGHDIGGDGGTEAPAGLDESLDAFGEDAGVPQLIQINHRAGREPDFTGEPAAFGMVIEHQDRQGCHVGQHTGVQAHTDEGIAGGDFGEDGGTVRPVGAELDIIPGPVQTGGKIAEDTRISMRFGAEEFEQLHAPAGMARQNATEGGGQGGKAGGRGSGRPQGVGQVEERNTDCPGSPRRLRRGGGKFT